MFSFWWESRAAVRLGAEKKIGSGAVCRYHVIEAGYAHRNRQDETVR